MKATTQLSMALVLIGQAGCTEDGSGGDLASSPDSTDDSGPPGGGIDAGPSPDGDLDGGSAIDAGDDVPDEIEVGALRIHFINVGAGNCVLVECPGPEAPPMIVDCGTMGATETDMTQDEARTYIQGLLSRHPAAQPNVVLSHADTDHYGWVPHVLAGAAIGHVWMGGNGSAYTERDFPTWLTAAESGGAEVHDGFPADWHNDGEPLGDDLPCGAASTFVLTVNSGGGDNAGSLVLMIEYGDFRAILSGDAVGATENQAIKNYDGDVRATVLSGSHHGAATGGSNSEDWAEATAPMVTVFSAGDRYYHPRCAAVDAYREYLAQANDHPARCGVSGAYRPKYRTRQAEYMTEINGTVMVTSDGGNGLDVHCTRTPGCGLVPVQ